MSRGRPVVELIDAPMGAHPVGIEWRKRWWRCPEPACPMGAFTEQNPAIAARRALLTTRAVDWAIGQLRQRTPPRASPPPARYWTDGRAIKPVLALAAADE